MSNPAKMVRGQLRQLTQEIFPEIFTKEVQNKILEQVSPLVTTTLSEIKDYLAGMMKQYQDQTRAHENEMLTVCSEQLHEMNITLETWKSLMTEKLKDAFVVGDNFDAEFQTRRTQIKKLIEEQPADAPAEQAPSETL